LASGERQQCQSWDTAEGKNEALDDSQRGDLEVDAVVVVDVPSSAKRRDTVEGKMKTRLAKMMRSFRNAATWSLDVQ